MKRLAARDALLTSLEEASEGAVGDDLVSERNGRLGSNYHVLVQVLAENRGVGHVLLPLGVVLEVVLHQLMAEEHVIVTPVGGHEVRVRHELANERLSAAKLSREISGVDVEESGANRDRGVKISLEGDVVGGRWVRELTSGLKAERPGERDVSLDDSVRTVISHVGESDGLDIGGCGLESEFERDQGLVLGFGDVVNPVVGEEVEIVLTIDAEHGHEVGGVDAVTEELYSHAGPDVGGLGVDGGSRGHADVAVVGALEDASVGVVTLRDPLDLADVSDGVDSLVAAAGP